MATITSSNPPAVRAPTGYTHGLLLEGVERRLIISGQVGLAPDGRGFLYAVGDSIERRDLTGEILWTIFSQGGRLSPNSTNAPRRILG